MKKIFKFLPVILAAVLIIFTGAFLHRTLFGSRYFTVDSAKLAWHDEFKVASPYRYDKLSETGVGENIFKLDIKTLAMKISSEHTEFKNCTIRRAFPNELVLDIYVRQPAVQMDYGKFYLVDKEGILLSEPRSAAMKGIVIVTGINWKPSGRVGVKLQSPRLFKALKLAGAVEESGLLDEHTMERIDVSDHRNLTLLLDKDLQIKIGCEHFDRRLELLKEALSSSYINKDDLEYIDLRFDDIIFGTR